jgi:hypothetical protein
MMKNYGTLREKICWEKEGNLNRQKKEENISEKMSVGRHKVI